MRADGATGRPVERAALAGVGHRRGATKSQRGPSVALVLWIVGVVTLPVYVFDSGRPQPAHVVLLLCAAAAFLQFKSYAPQFRRLIRAYGFFVVVVTVVTIVWAILAPGDVTLIPPVFALFNFVILRTVLVLYTHDGQRFLRWTSVGLALVLVALAVYTLATGQFGLVRSSGTFNNPNQQAFFAVVSISAVVAIGRALPIDWRLELGALTAATYLVAAANSKAGLVALAIVLAVVAVTNPRIALAAAVLAVVFVAFTATGDSAFDKLESRLYLPQSDDTLQERGYGLLLEHPEYLIVGSGEGYAQRFDFPKEIHSTLGTVAFAYGVAGLASFGLILVALARGGGVMSLLLLAPSLTYGLAHNGLRFTPFWMLVGLVAACADIARRPYGTVRPGKPARLDRV